MKLDTRRLSVAIPLLAAGLGCSDDFAPYSRLDRLRVLAIQAEPANPMPGETTTLSALVYAPPGAPVTYHWAWCPASTSAANSYTCPLEDGQSKQVFAGALDSSVATAVPSLDLGSGTSAAFTNPFALDALAALCQTGLASPVLARSFDCEGGFPVTVVLDVSTPEASLRAGFVLRLPTSAASQRNLNPVPAGLRLGETSLTEPPAAISLSPSETVELGVDIPASAIEIRPNPLYLGQPGQRPERLTASWFADTGKIDKARTSYIDGETTLEETSRNRWTVPAAEEWPAGGLVNFTVVLRDDRGGAGWISRRVVMEQKP